MADAMARTGPRPVGAPDGRRGRRVALVGVPSEAGAYGVGQYEAPAALRQAGLVERLAEAGAAMTDLGDSSPWPWRPDRNTGLPRGAMFRSLEVLAAGGGLAAITVTEITPKNAAVEDGLLDRFVGSLATAIGGRE